MKILPKKNHINNGYSNYHHITERHYTIQDYSFFLPIINILICKWIKLIQYMSNIYMANFIDNSYIWYLAENKQMFETTL